MNRKQKILQHDCLGMISKFPLLEMLGENRVLIENHQGVVGYSTEEIKIKVSFGAWIVSGMNLKFMQINRNQIVINGKIYSVNVQGR